MREYGVLASDPRYQLQDQRSGIRFFEYNVYWSSWEPEQGEYSTGYIEAVRSDIEKYAAAGDTVAVSIGLQTPPSWVSSLQNGTLRDQNGNVADLAPNYEFSAAVQAAEVSYIQNVTKSLAGLVSQYRLGLGTNGEMIYPFTPAPAGGLATASTWWIGSDTTDLPTGVGPNPMPGWVPGSSTWDGNSVTVSDANTWYSWYLHALENATVVEGDAFRGAGFTGQLALLAPGVGTLPALYQSRVDNLLGDPKNEDFYGTMNVGAVWQRSIPYVAAHLPGPLIVDGTGAGDTSGASGQIDCQPSDASVQTAPGSTGMKNWSSIRWTHALAVQSNLPYEIESAAPNSSVAEVFSLFRSCNAEYLQWLDDDTLEDGGTGSPPDLQLAYQQSRQADPFNEQTYSSEIAQNPLK